MKYYLQKTCLILINFSFTARRAPSPPKISKKPADEMNLEQIDMNNDTIAHLTKKIENLTISSPIIASSPKQHLLSETDSTNAIAKFTNYGENGSKNITKSALENISKAGTTTRYSFKPTEISTPMEQSTSHPQISNQNVTQLPDSSKLLNGDSVADANPQIGIICPLLVVSKVQLEASSSSHSASSSANVNCNGVVMSDGQEMEPVTTLAPVQSTTISSNMQNTENDTEDKSNCDINLISNLLKDSVHTTVTTSQTATITTAQPAPIESPHNHEKTPINYFPLSSSFNQPNSIVFNFKHRKDVPDYIDSNGLVVRRQREMPKPGESGYVLLGDISVETSTDTDMDDAWTLFGPPSPCDVTFKNANILINGRSNIRNRTKYNRQQNIQFHEVLIAMYEYPSENSIDNDSSCDGDGDADDSNTMEPTQNGVGGANNFMGAVPSIGSVPLGNYTPLKATTFTNNFELGVTPSASTSLSADSSAGVNGNIGSMDVLNDEGVSTSTSINGGETAEYLKPATDGEIVVYSEGVSDLLF